MNDEKVIFAGMVVALAGCVQVDRYEDVVKAPAPAGLAGFWQTKGPQSAMMSPDAIASLIVTKEGDTFDCRQWQRVIAQPGKLMNRDSGSQRDRFPGHLSCRARGQHDLLRSDDVVPC